MHITCRYTGIPFEARTWTETVHPQLRSLLCSAHEADIGGYVVRRLLVARLAGVTDIDVFVTFATTGDVEYLASHLELKATEPA